MAELTSLHAITILMQQYFQQNNLADSIFLQLRYTRAWRYGLKDIRRGLRANHVWNMR